MGYDNYDWLASEHPLSLDFDRRPRWERQIGAWRVRIYPVPRPSHLRSTPNPRPVTLRGPGSMHQVTSPEALRRKLKRKAQQYGRPEEPVVIAVDVLGDGMFEKEIIDVLFGTEVLHCSVGSAQAGRRRRRDGFWTRGGRPRNLHVSAVLVADGFTPWQLSRSATVVANPWATYPVDPTVLGLPSVTVAEDGRPTWTAGDTLATVFGLHPGWPHEEPAPGEADMQSPRPS